MLIRTMISAALAILVGAMFHQFYIISVQNDRRLTTQHELDIVHAQSLAMLNNLPNLRKAIGLSENQLTEDSVALSGTSSIVACLGSVGLGCDVGPNGHNGKEVDLSSLLPKLYTGGSATVYQANRNGADCAPGTCQFTQTVIAKWICDQPYRCTQLSITLNTQDPVKKTTKFHNLTSTISIPARSLLNRAQINFACAVAAGPGATFVSSLNYNSGLALCDSILPYTNDIGTPAVTVPARAIAADNTTEVQNIPGSKFCPFGYATYAVWSAYANCMNPDWNLIIAGGAGGGGGGGGGDGGDGGGEPPLPGCPPTPSCVAPTVLTGRQYCIGSSIGFPFP